MGVTISGSLSNFTNQISQETTSFAKEQEMMMFLISNPELVEENPYYEQLSQQLEVSVQERQTRIQAINLVMESLKKLLKEWTDRTFKLNLG